MAKVDLSEEDKEGAAHAMSIERKDTISTHENIFLMCVLFLIVSIIYSYALCRSRYRFPCLAAVMHDTPVYSADL